MLCLLRLQTVFSLSLSVIARDNSKEEDTTPDLLKYNLEVYVKAHRGAYKEFGLPENSRASLRKAIELGVFSSETDVYKTPDGCLVINHDGTINGKTITATNYNGEGGLNEIKLSNGEQLPLLNDFLDILDENPDSKTKLEIELKDPNAVDDILELVTERNLKDRVKFTTNNVTVGKKIVAFYGKSTIDVFHFITYSEPDLETLKSYGFMSFGSSGSTEAGVKAALAAGFQVEPWMVETEDAAKQFMLWGATSLSTDYPKLLLDMIADLKKQKQEYLATH